MDKIYESQAVEWLKSLLFIVDTQYPTFILTHNPLIPLLFTKRTVNTAALGLNSSLTAGEVGHIKSGVKDIIISNAANSLMVF